MSSSPEAPPPYPAAVRAAAHAHAALGALAAAAGEPAAGEGVPAAALVARVIDTAFWASLRREEGVAPTISLAFLAAARAVEPLTFRRRIPLTAVTLTRLAPAVKRPGIHLGVSHHGGVPALWGTTRRLPPFTLVLEVVEPGLLVLKHSQPGDRAKFVNLVVLEGEQAKVIDHGAGAGPGCPPPLARQFGLDVAGGSWAPVAERLAPLLLELAVSMRAHGHGGTLLVVPDASETWPLSLARANPYALTPPYRALAAALPALDAPGDADGDADGSAGGDGAERRPARRPGLDALRPAIEAIAGLTAVDGATVLRGGREVVAFGATIVRRRGSPQVRHALVGEPVVGSAPALMPLAQLGGTRHRSAAQFVHDQRDALALVASQDGRSTLFAWHPEAGAVSARRLEALLL